MSGSINSDIRDNRESDSSWSTDSALPQSPEASLTPTLTQAIGAAERFKDIGLSSDNSSVLLRSTWNNQDRRTLFFLLAEESAPSSLAEITGISRSQTSLHMNMLLDSGLAEVVTKGKRRYYKPNLGTLAEALGESNAIAAMEDHFLSAGLLSVSREVQPRAPLHQKMFETFKTLASNERRLPILQLIIGNKSEGSPVTLETLLKKFPDASEKALSRDLTILKRAQLIRSHRPHMQLKAAYSRNVSPLITILNDLNETFGEGEVVDLTTRGEHLDLNSKSTLQAATKTLQALSTEACFQTYSYVIARGPRIAQSVVIGRKGAKYQRQEQRNVSKLLEAGLVQKRKVDGDITLSSTFTPLRGILKALLR